MSTSRCSINKKNHLHRPIFDIEIFWAHADFRPAWKQSNWRKLSFCITLTLFLYNLPYFFSEFVTISFIFLLADFKWNWNEYLLWRRKIAKFHSERQQFDIVLYHPPLITHTECYLNELATLHTPIHWQFYYRNTCLRVKVINQRSACKAEIERRIKSHLVLFFSFFYLSAILYWLLLNLMFVANIEIGGATL